MLAGSVVIIALDLSIPHITQNRVHSVFEIIRNLRYMLQFAWIIKLAFESRKLFIANKENLIIFDSLAHDGDDEIHKMALWSQRNTICNKFYFIDFNFFLFSLCVI